VTFTMPLAGLRELTAQFRPDTAVIQRATDTSTGDGTSQVWATVATVSCRVSRIGSGGSEGVGAGAGIQAIGQRRIKVPALTDVTAKDRIVISGTTYEVVDVPTISYETERTVIAREVS
jgi:head-tail adaptor